MKIIRYAIGRKTGYGILEDGTVQSLKGNPYPRIIPGASRYQLRQVKLLAPATPSKIVAIGLNYRRHAEELEMALPDEPLFFLKPSTSVIGPEDNIVYPPDSRRLDYEGELALVIGKPARRVSVREAISCVLGYTCLNDVTARDFQVTGRPWTRSKGYDTFAPIGPCIETELDPDNVTLQTRLNGAVKQQASTADFIFRVAELISAISRVMTLLPGDVIATGTPSGVGPMQRGDTIEINIEPIGTLRNHII